jgi:hypothetical protein
MNSYDRNFIEINLSSEKTVQKQEALNKKLFIGMEMEDGKRFFISMMHNQTNSSFYAIIDPTKMEQFSGTAYPSLDELFVQFDNNSKIKVKKFLAFVSSNELIVWSLGEDNGAGRLIVFDNDKYELSDLDGTEPIGLTITNDVYHIIHLPSGELGICFAQSMQIIKMYNGGMAGLLAEVKKEYGDVKAFAFTNTDTLYAWISRTNVQGGFYALSKD